MSDPIITKTTLVAPYVLETQDYGESVHAFILGDEDECVVHLHERITDHTAFQIAYALINVKMDGQAVGEAVHKQKMRELLGLAEPIELLDDTVRRVRRLEDKVLG